MTKICSRCEEVKDFGQFCKDKHRPDGLTIYCKSCQKLFRQNAPEWVKENRRKAALDSYHSQKDDPDFKLKRQLYEHVRYKSDHRRAYRAKSQAKRPKIISGQPGSARYEAKLAGFRSGFERTLDLQLKSLGVKYAYESTKIPYILKGLYTPDFYLIDQDIYLELKGVLTVEDRRKMRAVKDQNPEIDVRFVFMDADKKVAHAKSTHAEWAIRNGFLWANKEVPQSWLDEKKKKGN